jgi:hypothetical protein
MRSNAEYFNDPDKSLSKRSPLESFREAHRCALAAEFLARHVLTRIVEQPSLWGHFDDDDRFEAFWQQPAQVATLWGQPFDIDASLASFRKNLIGAKGS